MLKIIINLKPTDEDRIIDMSFSMGGEDKRQSTCFLGMSPAFEMALYTLCFLAGEEENHLKIGNSQ